MDANMRHLLNNRLDALYSHDANNRLLAVNEPDTNQETPCLVIMRGEANLLWRVRHDVPDDIVASLGEVLQSEPATNNFASPLKYHSDYSDILEQYAPLKRLHSGPAYILSETSSTKAAVRITSHNAHLAEEHFPYTLEILDFRSPVIAVIDGDSAISVCFSARKTDTVAEAGVFTIEDYRKKGYALRVVQDWSIAIRDLGIIPIYSTSADNIASQSVAKKLGAIQFATDFGFY